MSRRARKRLPPRERERPSRCPSTFSSDARAKVILVKERACLYMHYHSESVARVIIVIRIYCQVGHSHTHVLKLHNLLAQLALLNSGYLWKIGLRGLSRGLNLPRKGES